MTSRLLHRALGLSFAWALVAALVVVAPDRATAAGPFDGLDGLWAGVGTIALRDGTKERMRCRGQYLVRDDANNLQLSLICNSDSYQFHVNSYTASADGRLSGRWSETTRNVSGQVTGTATQGRVDISVSGGAVFAATMSLSLRSDKQSVVIKPTGTGVAQVSATLQRMR
jgi:hypothetical protein